jgi:hypothetical protein
LSLVTNGVSKLNITPTGLVGIGTALPTEKLEVQGSVKIVDGTQGLGKVLTSDANGKADWQIPATSNVIVGTIPPAITSIAGALGNNNTYSGVSFVLSAGVWEIEYQNWGYIDVVPNNGFFYTSLSTSNASVISPTSYSNNKTCLTMPYFNGDANPTESTRVITGKWMITVPAGGQTVYVWNGVSLNSAPANAFYQNAAIGAAGPYSYSWAKKIL